MLRLFCLSVICLSWFFSSTKITLASGGVGSDSINNISPGPVTPLSPSYNGKRFIAPWSYSPQFTNAIKTKRLKKVLLQPDKNVLVAIDRKGGEHQLGYPPSEESTLIHQLQKSNIAVDVASTGKTDTESGWLGIIVIWLIVGACVWLVVFLSVVVMDLVKANLIIWVILGIIVLKDELPLQYYYAQDYP